MLRSEGTPYFVCKFLQYQIVKKAQTDLGREYTDERFAQWVTYLKDRYLF